MPPAFHVRAGVIDVRSDAPRPTDRFLVDTNVWAWVHDPSSRFTSSGGIVAQAPVYERYVAQTRLAGARRCRAAASLAELAHLIEHFEHVNFVAGVSPVDLKEYRHNYPSERARIVGAICKAWGLIEGDSELLPLTLDDALAAGALSRLAAAQVDGYDLFLLAAMESAGVTQILTDDGDFCTVAGIEVFTANPRALAAARAQGRLAVR
jgi:predicted nucleic acid-binding protein